ncbi:MAG: tetrahydrofolate dehydrogenase/cyclohydrolase catalytic domain-containing protein [Clostridia bacterium]|nr:tetrahydrofolate dehydrogenase/cyclohydrolase catalytic domain-containing protein [Clostridia bacterium]
MGVIVKGKPVADALLARVQADARMLVEKGAPLCLAVILVGDDAASQIYVGKKHETCAKVGIESRMYHLPATTSQESLLDLIQTLNEDKKVTGILVQLPLPAHIHARQILRSIDTHKDVDAFSMLLDMSGDDLVPCTAGGILELIHSTGVQVAGKNCVVVGRSNIVGKPMAMLLLQENGTVTICHSGTVDLGEKTKQADILIVAVGKKKLITADMVKDGAFVVDIGMNRDGEGKLCGDVDFEAIKDKASYITPVPGGVGPMTIAMLMVNTVEAAKRQFAAAHPE